MSEKNWRITARQQIDEEIASFDKFKERYTPLPSRAEMWAYLKESNISIWDIGNLPMSDHDLAGICCEVAWQRSKAKESEGEHE